MMLIDETVFSILMGLAAIGIAGIIFGIATTIHMILKRRKQGAD